MATNNEIVLTWGFYQKAEPSDLVKATLLEDEVIHACYKTVRDTAVITDKRILICDAQGLTGKKVEIYSLPYRSIDMWSTENAGRLFDMNAELELWTKAGHFKIKVDAKCDIREFDQILGRAILG